MGIAHIVSADGRRRTVSAAALAMALALIGLLAALPAEAAKGSYPRSYNPETAPGFTNTFSGKDALGTDCPESLAATPGSDPASEVLNFGLNSADSFRAGGTVHFTYLDSPPTGRGTQRFTIEDCVVTYPSGFFSASDFDPSTGVLTNAAYSKKRLSKGGTQIDGASLSGTSSSVGNIYYSWTAPTNLADGTWVCNFARDIKNSRGGATRKTPPTCYQVKPHGDPAIRIFLGYADGLHGAQVVPTPWAGDPGVVFLGCTGAAGCGGEYAGGAIRFDNPVELGAMTLLEAYVDIGPCHFAPWGRFLPASVGPGGKLILTQTGILGPPQPAPCDGQLAEGMKDVTNFDTFKGPFAPGTDRSMICAPGQPAPVITLVFDNGTNLKLTDADKVLSGGGADPAYCTPGAQLGRDWTRLPLRVSAQTTRFVK